MRTANDTLITAPSTVSGNWESESLYVGRTLNYSFQFNFNGATAVVKLQCSIDAGQPDANSPDNHNVTNWTDIDSSEVVMDGSGIGVFDVSEVGYNWVRIVIIGTANLDTMRFNGKGW
jgi:hypothetical protein